MVVRRWGWWLLGLWLLDVFWVGLVGWHLHFRCLAGNWIWTISLGFCYYFHVLFYIYFLVVSGFRPLISPYQILVGVEGLCPGLRTLCAWSALVRGCALVKWSQPPSGKMKRRATGSSGWLHSEKAELIDKLWFGFGMIFLVCRLYCKAISIVSDAILAKWCLFEYIFLLETLAIIARHTLDAYCNLGFSHYVPPLVFFCFTNEGLRAAGALVQKKRRSHAMVLKLLN